MALIAAQLEVVLPANAGVIPVKKPWPASVGCAPRQRGGDP